MVTDPGTERVIRKLVELYHKYLDTADFSPEEAAICREADELIRLHFPGEVLALLEAAHPKTKYDLRPDRPMRVVTWLAYDVFKFSEE